MKTGEILLLKEGIFGLRTGENIGIYLGRERVGKHHLYLIFTLKGKQRVKQENVMRHLSGFSYSGNPSDESAMRRYLLHDIIPGLKQWERNRVKLSPEAVLKQVGVKDLWQFVISFMGWEKEKRYAAGVEREPEDITITGMTTQEIAQVYFFPARPLKEHVSAIRTILSVCENMHYGYFQRKKVGKEERFIPYLKEEMAAVERHIARLNTLKGFFVEWREKEESSEDDEKTEESTHGRRRKLPHLIVEDPATVELPPDIQMELELVLKWSECYLRYGNFNFEDAGNGCPIFGLGGTPIRILPGFNLEKFLRFFAQDIVQNQKIELHSALVSLLLIFRRVNYKEASELLLEYFVASGRVHLHLKFRKSVVQAAERLPDNVCNEELAGRKDLTSIDAYTIDPVDAKDFDDAISIRVREKDDPQNGFRRRVIELYVHIADVSHYVRPHSIVDEEARFRATSVYLPTGVVPMLPEKLSNHLCSLVAGEIRLAVSTCLTFDADTLEVLEKKHFDSFICVKENLSYEMVEEKIKDGVEPFVTMLKLANRLSEKYRRLELESPERKLRFTSDGNGFDISLKYPTSATRMIENFMVITNEAVADTLSEANVPALYRIHPLPDRERVERFNGMCSALGYDELKIEVDWDALSSKHRRDKKRGADSSDDLVSALISGGKITLGGFVLGGDGIREEEKSEQQKDTGELFQPINPEDLRIFVEAFQRTLSGIKAKERELRNMLTDRLLSTLPRASYSPFNHGHFGLNSLSYCHFTSPIRRYPDILVHRALKYLINREHGRETPWEPPGSEEISTMSEICNEQSQSAEDLERQMVDIALAIRLFVEKDYRNKTYHAMVSGLTPTSIFLNMDGFTEGRIPLSHLSKERLTVDEYEARVLKYNELTGEETEILRLGERVSSMVYSVDVGEGKIELKL